MNHNLSYLRVIAPTARPSAAARGSTHADSSTARSLSAWTGPGYFRTYNLENAT